jgi:catechol 2,3-dioxygenase-like lactoylglutathione lyase family enzyme
MQLNASQVTVMLPVRNLARAREFYEQALALPAGEERRDGKVVYRCGGTEIALFPRPEGTKAEHTAVSWTIFAPRSGSSKAVVCCSPTTTCRGSRRSSTSACWVRRKPHGSTIRKETSSACTRISRRPRPRRSDGAQVRRPETVAAIPVTAISAVNPYAVRSGPDREAFTVMVFLYQTHGGLDGLLS